MKYGKKILSLLLAAVLAAGVLATGASAGEIDTDTVDLGNVKFIGVYAQAEETLRLTYTDYESGEAVKEEITATVYTLFNTADTVVYTHSAVSKFMPYRLQADGSYKQEGLGVQGGIGAGGGVTDVSHSDLAGSKALQPLPGKCLACQPHTPPDGEHPIVVHGNASTLLAAVLEGKEPVIGKGRNIRRLRREQAEHAALLM